MRKLERARCRLARLVAMLVIASSAGTGMARADERASEKPVPPTLEALFVMRGIEAGAPIYIRVFKEESELELWKATPDGRYVAVKTYPICAWSGDLGPKKAQGDRMSPEGFYGFGYGGLKPDSKYHLAMNVGYPNRLDRALGRTGGFIMVHGKCVSVGCFAMTNDYIEEIYALVRVALDGGQSRVPVHIFPFRMTNANMARHRNNAAYATWGPLKDAYDDFAQTLEPPKITSCGGKYVVNALAPISGAPKDACPTRIGKLISPLPPRLRRNMSMLGGPLVAEGAKNRNGAGKADALPWSLFGSSTAQSSPGSRKEPDKVVIGAGGATSIGSLTPLLDRR